jgi:leucyl aminopeptidase
MLAVNRGSQYPPKLVIVRYNGAPDRGEKYTALVGKGLTFDSGGLNIKGTGNIEEMRLDMAGAGAVLGVLRNTLHFKPAKNLLFAFALVENAVDAMSYKPGDVYVGYAGKSVEIANTDAEGRLVLADANAYVCKNFPVKTLVNIATLTGAVLVALARTIRRG